MKEKETFIFIGQSGAGKGTQVALLQQYLSENHPNKKTFYLQTGAEFREFFKGQSYSHQLAREIYNKGERQPGFLAIHMWAGVLIERFKGEEHLIIDGTPRSLNEAYILDNALKFYERNESRVIFINVSRKWAKEKLLNRGREDDREIEDVEHRLDWFEKDVVPAVNFFRNNSEYNFVEINGEQPISNVHQDIIKKIFTQKGTGK